MQQLHRSTAKSVQQTGRLGLTCAAMEAPAKRPVAPAKSSYRKNGGAKQIKLPNEITLTKITIQ